MSKLEEDYKIELKEQYNKEIREYYMEDIGLLTGRKIKVEREFEDPRLNYEAEIAEDELLLEQALQEQSDKPKWIDQNKFRRDLMKRGTESYEIYREWKKNQELL